MDKLEIIFEDKDILVINKPSGIAVERRESETFDCVSSLVLEHYKTSGQKAKNLIAGVCHRLDKPVNGLLLLAKKMSILKKINEEIEAKRFEKKYIALCLGESNFQHERLTHYHFKNTKLFKAELCNEAKEGFKKVVLTAHTISNTNGQTKIEIKLETGRYHQIRSQLAYSGFPIWNDVLYGAPKESEENKICLTAYFLAFEHPVTKEWMEFELEI